MKGTIARLIKEKRFGFIKAANTDYFFHATAVKNATFEELEAGQEVEFEPNEGTKGPRAEDVYA